MFSNGEVMYIELKKMRLAHSNFAYPGFGFVSLKAFCIAVKRSDLFVFTSHILYFK